MAGPTVPERLKDIETSISGFRNWLKGAGAVAGVLLLFTGWWFHTEFMPAFHGMQTALDGHNTRISMLEGELSVLKLHAQANLPTEEFEHSLPSLESALSTAQREKQSLTPYVLARLQEKLLATNENTAQFWPTLSKFITYRSIVFTPGLEVDSKLPDCTDHDPKPMKVTAVRPGPNKTNLVDFSKSEYENCRITLDSPKDDLKINALIAERAPFLTFTHCLIVYRGGPIKLTVALNKVPYKVTMGNLATETVPFTGQTLHFESCVFDFSLGSAPPPEGQRIANFLLAQSSSTFEIPMEKQL